jgi:hypothetical protein
MKSSLSLGVVGGEGFLGKSVLGAGALVLAVVGVCTGGIGRVWKAGGALSSLSRSSSIIGTGIFFLTGSAAAAEGWFLFSRGMGMLEGTDVVLRRDLSCVAEDRGMDEA